MKIFEVLESQDYNKDIIAEDSNWHRIADIYDNLGIPNINTLHGSMHLSKNINLKSLKNAPKEITKTFECFACGLSSLKNSPTKVGGRFDVSSNKLTSLVGGPTSVGGEYMVYDNLLDSIKGAPEFIGKDANFQSNNITSLVGIEKQIKTLNGVIFLQHNPIKEGGIGLLLIKGIRGIFSDSDSNKEFADASKIILKYMGKGRAGLLECQEELIEAGLERFAKL